MMSAAVAVTGMTVTYTLDSSLAAAAKAQIQANSIVNIGTEANPIKASVDVGTTGQTVTVTSTDRTYVLGQFLKIQKTKEADQDASYSPNTGNTAGVVAPKPKSFPTVKAKTPSE